MEELNAQFAASWLQHRPKAPKSRAGSSRADDDRKAGDGTPEFDPNFELTINHMQQLCDNFDSFGALRLSRVLIAITRLPRCVPAGMTLTLSFRLPSFPWRFHLLRPPSRSSPKKFRA